MKNWNTLKKELLKNKATAAEYKKLEPQYQVISQLIEARTKKGITQAELAKKMGTIGFLEKAAKALGTPINLSIG